MPIEDYIIESNSVRTARQFLAAQERYRVRVSRSSRLRNTTPPPKEPSIRDTTKRFKCRKLQLTKYLKALQETGSLDLSLQQVRRLHTLYDNKDTTLEAYTSQFIQSGYISLAIYDLIEDATNRLYIRHISLEGPISCTQQLYQRRNYLQFRTTIYRPIEIAYLSIKESIAIFNQFYNKLEDIVETYYITISIYQNVDKIDYYITILSRKVKILAIQIEKNKQVYRQLIYILFIPRKILTIVFSQLEITDLYNRELITLISYRNRVGNIILPFYIFKQQPTKDQDISSFDKDIRFVHLETIFNNYKLILDWIRLFNKYSFLAYIEFKRYEVTFEKQFSYNEYFKSNGNSIKPDDYIKEDTICI